MAGTMVVRSEEDAWDFLAIAMQAGQGQEPPAVLDFQGWPAVRIHIEGRHSAIAPPMMEAFLTLQEGIYRTQAQLRYGVPDIRRLTDEEKQKLQIEVVVKAGSSDYAAALENVGKHFVDAVRDKVNGWHIVATVLGCALIYGGATTYKDYLNNVAEVRKLEVSAEQAKANADQVKANLATIEALSDKETERTKLLAAIVSKSQDLQAAQVAADNAREVLVKAIAVEGGATVNGTHVDAAAAAELQRTTRKPRRTIEIREAYRIEKVDTTAQDGFRVHLQNVASRKKLVAGLQDAIVSNEIMTVIQQAEWNKMAVNLTIEATMAGENIVKAIIINATPVPVDRK